MNSLIELAINNINKPHQQVSMFLTILSPIFWAHAIGEFRYITDEAEVFVLNRTQLHEFKIQIIDETNASNVINSD